MTRIIACHVVQAQVQTMHYFLCKITYCILLTMCYNIIRKRDKGGNKMKKLNDKLAMNDYINNVRKQCNLGGAC